MGIIEDFHTSKTKLIKTSILCFAYITLGFGIAIIGPTMIDLGYLVDAPVSSMNYLLVSRALGTIISCFLTDFHKKYLSFEKILAISQFIMGITLFIIPFFNLIGMNIIIFIYGYAGGCFQVFGDLWTMRIWNKKRAAIYIQWVYFFFSMGAFIAPLLSTPFLAPTTKNNNPFNELDKLTLNNKTISNSTDKANSDTKLKHTIADLKVMYPYMISGVYAIIISVILYVIDATSSKKKEYTQINNENDTDEEKPRCSKSLNNKKNVEESAEIIRSCDKEEDDTEKTSLLGSKKSISKNSLINSSEFSLASAKLPNFLLIKVLSVLFINLFIGFDVTFGTYLSVFVFVNDGFGFSTQQGALLTALFWGAYTFAFRIPGYYIIQRKGPSYLMNLEMLITFLSTVLLSFILVSSNSILLWSSVLLEGLGMSIVYSTYLAFLKTKFEPSARLFSWFVLSFNVGSFAYPFVVGMYIEKYPMIFIYLSIFCCLSTSAIYVYVRFLFRKWK